MVYAIGYTPIRGRLEISPLTDRAHMRYNSCMAARAPGLKDVNISLRLTPQMRADAERAAADADMTLAEWFRHVIRERLARSAA